MTKWFVQQNGGLEDLGPLRPNELLELVRSGDVTLQSMLRKDDSTYFVASDVGGLFEAAMRPTIRYFCPKCRTEVSEPPVMCHKCDHNVTRALTQIKENSILDRADQSITGQAGSSVKNWLKKKRLSNDREKEL